MMQPIMYIDSFETVYPAAILRERIATPRTQVHEVSFPIPPISPLVLKRPAEEKYHIFYHAHIEDLYDYIVPIVDASWRHLHAATCDSHPSLHATPWILCREVDDTTTVSVEDACAFLLRAIPAMIACNVYWTDMNIDNLCMFRGEVRIMDYEFAIDSASIVYPFDTSDALERILLEKCASLDHLMYALALVMIQAWHSEVSMDDPLLYDSMIDQLCIHATSLPYVMLDVCIQQLLSPYLDIHELPNINPSLAFPFISVIASGGNSYASTTYISDVPLVVYRIGAKVEVYHFPSLPIDIQRRRCMYVCERRWKHKGRIFFETQDNLEI